MRGHAQAVALTYCEAFIIGPSEFAEAGASHPGPMEQILRRMRRITAMRAILRKLCRMNGVAPRSFIMQPEADGYVYAKEPETLEGMITRMLGRTADDSGGPPSPAPRLNSASSSARPPPPAAGEGAATSTQLAQLEDGQRKMEARFTARMNEMADSMLKMEVLLQRAVETRALAAAAGTQDQRADSRRRVHHRHASRGNPQGDNVPIGEGVNDA